MAEDLHIIQGDKKTQYETLIPQIQGLLTGESNLVANTCECSCRIKRTIQLVLGGILLGD
jgi:GAF domain-containing protein